MENKNKKDNYVEPLRRPRVLCATLALAMSISFGGKLIFQAENENQTEMASTLEEIYNSNEDFFIEWGHEDYFYDNRITPNEFEELYRYIINKEDEIEFKILNEAYANGIVTDKRGNQVSIKLDERIDEEKYENIDLSIKGNLLVINYKDTNNEHYIDLNKYAIFNEENKESLEEYGTLRKFTDFRGKMTLLISDDEKIKEYTQRVEELLKKKKREGRFGNVIKL